MNDHEELANMLQWRRPAGSRTERRFIKKFLLPLEMNIDRYGNLWKRIDGPNGEQVPVLWSCHTDTVHRTGGRQKLIVADGVYKANDKQSNCLGADDTAGVWIMKKMIEAKKPGLYVFHRAEEIGGGGSLHMVKYNKPLIEGIKYAIAFDRKGKEDIITHQGGLRCCSDDFAGSLSSELKMGHKNSSFGTFTDTANYVDLVPECTNLAVGYKDQHFKDEKLDSKYLFELRDAMMDVKVENLVEKRKAGDVDFDYWPGSYTYSSDGGWRHNHGSSSAGATHGVNYVKSSHRGTVRDVWKDDTGRYSNHWSTMFPEDEDQEPGDHGGSSSHQDYEKIVQLIKDNPREFADWLEEYGVGYDECAEMVWRRNGVIRSADGRRYVKS